jgi:hypothetical protein
VVRLTIFIFAILLFAKWPALANDHMAPSDVQATFFNGEPFTAATPSGTKYKMAFTPDGKVKREPIEQSGTKDAGTWKLSANGFCTTWTRSKPSCFTITPIAENKWSVEKIATTVAVRVAIWSK